MLSPPFFLVFGLGPQRDRGADRQQFLEGVSSLLAVGGLRHLWGIDAGHPDRDLSCCVLDTQGVAIAY